MRDFDPERPSQADPGGVSRRSERWVQRVADGALWVLFRATRVRS
jgi:hypothetical protein